MPKRTPTLHLLRGKVAAEKPPLTAKLAEPVGTALTAEDDWTLCVIGRLRGPGRPRR